MRFLLAIVVGAAFVSGCGAFPLGQLSNRQGCAALNFPERRCRAIVDRAMKEASLFGRTPVAAVVLPPDPPDGRLGGSMVARVRFEFADGTDTTQEVWCQAVGRADDLSCHDNAQITLSTGIDRDVPCAGEAPNGCATLPPTPPPAAVAAGRPLRIAALDIPLDDLGAHEVIVGDAELPNGYLSRRDFRLADVRPTTFWITGGVALEVRSTVAGRPVARGNYRNPFEGTEPVEVVLVFNVTETTPGAVLQVRDLVVE